MAVRYSDELKETICRLLAQGRKSSELATEYEIPVSSIHNFPKEMGRRAKAECKISAESFAPLPQKSGVFSSYRIGVLPDCQVKPSVDISHLSKIGQYFADKRPQTIVCIGDFADMESLCSHDSPGTKSVEGRRYHLDIESVQAAMLALMTPIREEMAKGWTPRLVMTLGNHEQRIVKAIENNPKLHGTIQLDDLRYEDWGWEVHPFLKPVIIEGIAFCHYFQTGQMGRPASSARAILNKQHMSCFAGHQQGRDIAYGKRGDGREMTAIICGSCLAPHHKVLTADLRYIELGEVKVGEKLVSFDEHLGMSGKRSRRYKTGTVTNIRKSVGELYNVTLSNGKVFTTTKDHKWLTNNCMGVRKWMETKSLRKGKMGTKVQRLLDEWETDNSREAGWLAGMYDGEGTLYARKTVGGNCTQLSIAQSYSHNPEICSLLVEAHSNKGFTLGNEGKNNSAMQWRITGGQSEIAKFLGSIRPSRMLRKFLPELLGTITTKYPKEMDYIQSVESTGLGEYMEIKIDAATMVVEGYGHHNCYLHDEEYLSPQTNNHFRGIYMLNDVVDGSFQEMPISLS